MRGVFFMPIISSLKGAGKVLLPESISFRNINEVIILLIDDPADGSLIYGMSLVMQIAVKRELS